MAARSNARAADSSVSWSPSDVVLPPAEIWALHQRGLVFQSICAVCLSAPAARLEGSRQGLTASQGRLLSHPGASGDTTTKARQTVLQDATSLTYCHEYKSITGAPSRYLSTPKKPTDYQVRLSRQHLGPASTRMQPLPLPYWPDI